jgi:probable phosphomutase (TIGR03848 family)
VAIFMLIRHGENEFVKKGRMAGRLPGVHLNEKGYQQAEELAEKLSKAPIKAVYSSPLERAMETAAPLAQKLSLQVISRVGLIEVDIGEWQGKKIKGLSRLKIWRTVQGLPSRMRFPSGETFVEAQYRIYQELEILSSMHGKDELIVCVSHSDPIKLAVAFYLGMPLDTFQRLSVFPASVTTLQIGEMGSRLLSLNYEFSISFPES